MSDLFPCAVIGLALLISLFLRPVFGWSCPCVKALSQMHSVKPHHLHVKWNKYSVSTVGSWGQEMAEMTCLWLPKILCWVCRLLCGVWAHTLFPPSPEGDPTATRFVVCSAGCEICLRWQWHVFFVTNHRTGWGRLVKKPWRKSLWAQDQPSCLACSDLDGNRFTSQLDELAAGHAAAGCFHPEWKHWVTCQWTINHRNYC